MDRSKKLIDGKKISARVISEVKGEVEEFSSRHRPPHLAVVIVGQDPASRIYVKSKIKKAARCGIRSTLMELQSDITQDKLEGKVEELNLDKEVDGILVQLPLPDQIDEHPVIEAISPQKDVDGFHPCNLGMLAAGYPRFIPCTPAGIIELLKRYHVQTSGKRAVVLGRSLIVGKPMAMLLSGKSEAGNATVTVCHSRTNGLEDILRSADILVAAVGKAEMIRGEMIKEGAVVIDVGINRVDDPGSKRGYRLKGDVEFKSAMEKAYLITPVPGGVGPMTVAMLMKNTLKASRMALEK